MDRNVTHHDAPKWATTSTTWMDNLSRLNFWVDRKIRLIFPQFYTNSKRKNKKEHGRRLETKLLKSCIISQKQ
uniref:Uncharacterized protein n=1 Tax=Arundo donax TaxID=35708 RepID=A0A0A9CFK3_ARUDO